MSAVDDFIKQRKAYVFKQQQIPVGQRNLYPESTEAQLAFDCVIEVLLGENWYVNDPICTGQVNTYALDEILYKHCRTYRRACKEQAKKGGSVMPRQAYKQTDVCPICGYEIEYCQCFFAGSCHPDRSSERRVVLEHLHFLSSVQLAHVMKLESMWDISYGDEKREMFRKNLKDTGCCRSKIPPIDQTCIGCRLRIGRVL